MHRIQRSRTCQAKLNTYQSRVWRRCKHGRSQMDKPNRPTVLFLSLHRSRNHFPYCKSHSTSDAIKALVSGWINWGGPPGLLVVDSGTEFGTEQFHKFLQEHDIKLRMIAPEAHWRHARIERHGGILQSILDKMDKEKPIETVEDLDVALSFATQTKNRWSRYKGYPPEPLVFGKLCKSPGSVTSEASQASQ